MLGAGSASWVHGQPFLYQPAEPTLDRWVYPFNFQPGTRVVAPTYGSFDPRFDTRDAEMLLGWDTGGAIRSQAGASRYLIRALRITLTSVAPVPPTKPFVYDPTHDAYTTYLTNEAGAKLDTDAGRPIELFGVGFRGGFNDETFKEDSAFGPLGPINGSTISIGTRNAYAAAFDEAGNLIDIGNHVGQKNAAWTNAPFEVTPWAVGATTNAAPGNEMPDGGRMTFSVELGDPLILAHVQQSLNRGRLRFMVSSLSPAGQSTPGGTGFGGAGAYPWWATKENLLYDAPILEIEGTVISDTDSDADGLPDDWEQYWFGSLSQGASDDPDGDGSTQKEEWLAGTDPMSAASVLKISHVTRDGGRVVLRHPFAANRTYRVEVSSDLIRWEEALGSSRYPQSGLREWRSEEEVSLDRPLFLRIRAE